MMPQILFLPLKIDKGLKIACLEEISLKIIGLIKKIKKSISFYGNCDTLNI